MYELDLSSESMKFQYKTAYAFANTTSNTKHITDIQQEESWRRIM